jgi:hypothetical protein
MTQPHVPSETLPLCTRARNRGSNDTIGSLYLVGSDINSRVLVRDAGEATVEVGIQISDGL